MRTRARRVTVKARIVKLNPQRGAARGRRFVSAKAVDAHLRYLERDGVNRDGEKGQVYSAERDAEDGRAFLDRGRDDRHQFRFIVSAEDGVELADLRQTTRDLMKTMEADLGTRLDWIAVDHHNTGHPHTHILLRGVTDDGKILNIAGDYIAHGIRERASEIVTLELGRQTELEVTKQLEREVDADRFTRLDRMLIAEQQGQGVRRPAPRPGHARHVPPEPGAADRARPQAGAHGAGDRGGDWPLDRIAARAEPTLRELGERGDIIKTMHRALERRRPRRGTPSRAICPARREDHRTDRRPRARQGLGGDEMGERVRLVIDGVDGRIHHVEMDAARLEEVGRGMIVAAGSAPTRAARRRMSTSSMSQVTKASIDRPSIWSGAGHHRQRDGDPEAFIRSHVRRLEALRRAGHAERIDADHWRVPADLAERGQAYDLARDRAKHPHQHLVSHRPRPADRP